MKDLTPATGPLQDNTMTNTKYLNTVLTVIAVLLAGNLWVGAHQSPSASTSPEGQAYAQGRVDAGQQRAEMITQLKSLKTSVDALTKKLTDGSVKVKVEGDPHHD